MEPKTKRTKNLSIREIHVGDWVQAWNPWKKSYTKPMKLKIIAETVVTHTDDGYTHFIKVENIDALPITKDILVALGFQEIMNSGWFIYRDNQIKYSLNTHTLHLKLKDTYYDVIHFHQLQQILFNNDYEIDFQWEEKNNQ
jgi:hypothetical protein